MVSMVKKIFIISILGSVILFTACLRNEHVSDKEIEKDAEKWMEYIVNEDAEALFDIFSSDIKENRKEETMSEIEKAFEFIDGKIVSYDYYGKGGGRENKDEGEIVYFNCYPEYQDVTTDTGKKYRIKYTYHYIWDEKPEREGVTKISISLEDDLENKCVVGRNYSYYE